MTQAARQTVEPGRRGGRKGVTLGMARAYRWGMSAHRRLILAGAVLLAVVAVLLASGAAIAMETASGCDRIGASAEVPAPVAPGPEPVDPDCLRCCVIHCQTLPPAGPDPLVPARLLQAHFSPTDDAFLTSRTEAEDPPPRF